MSRPMILLSLMSALGGCAQMFPGKVADGVARLTVRNVAGVLLAVNADETCGFASVDVDASPSIDGEVGDIGTVTYTVQDCTIDLGSTPAELSRDCHDVATMATGSMTVNATKTIMGRITGDPTTPVIPIDADSVTFDIQHAELTEFDVTKTGSDSHMKVVSGSLSASVSPRLATAAETGACAITTPHIRFDNIHWGPSNVVVTSGSKTFNTPIQSSDLMARNGVHGEYTNHVEGTLTVWNALESVLLSGESEGLDPDYAPELFESSYTCNEELAQPATFQCDFEPTFGDGASKLVVRNFGALAKAINADTACGFDSTEVLSTFTLDGDIGYAGGAATYRVRDCALHFPEPTAISTDCNGVTTFIEGTAVVSGTKIVEGYLTGSSETPVVPNSHTPATIDIAADVTGLRVTTSNSDAALTLQSGRLAGALTPTTLQDLESGACSIASPNALMTDIEFEGGQATLESEGRTFNIQLDDVSLLAANGEVDGLENHLEGQVVVDDVLVKIPLDGASAVLDPEYDPTTFFSSYACETGALVPTLESDCDFEATLAEAAGRLIIKNYGMVTKTVDLDEDCGFENTWDQVSEFASTDIFSAWWSDEMETVTWSVDDCAIDARHVVEDCAGNNYFTEGVATVTGTKSVHGMIVLANPPLQPQDRRSASFQFTEVQLQDFAALEMASGETGFKPYLTLHTGTMTGRSLPVTGEALDTPGSYFVKIPVSGFDGVRLRNATATLKSGDMTFHMDISDSYLSAFNGAYLDEANSLHGFVTLNGRTWDLGSEATPIELNPDYDQAAFDATYVCIDNLAAPVEVN